MFDVSYRLKTCVQLDWFKNDITPDKVIVHWAVNIRSLYQFQVCSRKELNYADLRTDSLDHLAFSAPGKAGWPALQWHWTMPTRCGVLLVLFYAPCQKVVIWYLPSPSSNISGGQEMAWCHDTSKAHFHTMSQLQVSLPTNAFARGVKQRRSVDITISFMESYVCEGHIW